jgi:hypothetical protein
VQSVERLLELVRIPDIHDHMLLEHAFDYKQIRQENKGIRSTRHRPPMIWARVALVRFHAMSQTVVGAVRGPCCAGCPTRRDTLKNPPRSSADRHSGPPPAVRAAFLALRQACLRSE